MKVTFTHLRAALQFLLVFSVSLCLCGSSLAGLDPELGKPYKLQVVLHVAEHRQLTKTFKDLLESELRDSLQAALGELAQVEVVRQHPKLAEIIDKGLSVMDTWNVLSDTKTHFVLVDFVNGQYEVQARQLDGLTGQPSPIVRRDRTPDPVFVARTTALLVGRDFGLVGTAEKADEKSVRVTLKGAKLGVPAELQPHKDEVFALVQIRQSGALSANRVPWALLQVTEEPTDGVCTCRLWNRHVNPMDTGPGILGYRCLKLATIKTAVRIRLVKFGTATLTPEANRVIEVRRRNFDEAVAVSDSTDPDGVFPSVRQKDPVQFTHIAFVSVMTPPLTNPRAQIPIALVDDRTVVIAVSIDDGDNLQLAIRRDQWVTQVYESLQVLVDQFKQVETLVSKEKKREEAVEKARAIIEMVGQDVTRLREVRKSLEEDAKKVKGFKLDLSDGDQRLSELKVGQDKLQDFITRVEQVIKEEKDPKRQELIAKAKLGPVLEGEGEYGKALDLYKEVIDAGAADAELKKHYEELDAAWKVKGDKHGEARKFIYETWATLDPLKIKENLDAARSAFEECKKAGDKLSPRRLRVLTVAHVGKLTRKVSMLDPSKDEDREIGNTIKDISEGLLKLVQDINAFVEK